MSTVSFLCIAGLIGLGAVGVGAIANIGDVCHLSLLLAIFAIYRQKRRYVLARFKIVFTFVVLTTESMDTQAAISADIIASTSLEANELYILKTSLESCFADVKKKVSPDFWGRIIKGDTIECIIPKVKDALRVGLMLKCKIKSLPLAFNYNVAKDKEEELRRKYFYNYGVRIAIGLGEMRVVDSAMDMMDGPAMYMAGRKIQDEGNSKSKRITIKQTLFIEADESLKKVVRPYQVTARLMDDIINGLTAKQASVVYCKLLGMTNEETHEFLKLAQSTVNTHISRASWHAIEEGLEYYESTITEQLP